MLVGFNIFFAFWPRGLRSAAELWFVGSFAWEVKTREGSSVRVVVFISNIRFIVFSLVKDE